MAKEKGTEKIPLDAVPQKLKKAKNKYWSRRPKPETSREKLIELMLELAKRL